MSVSKKEFLDKMKTLHKEAREGYKDCNKTQNFKRGYMFAIEIAVSEAMANKEAIKLCKLRESECS